MANKKEITAYIENIIDIIAENIKSLEKEKIKYGKFIQFVKGIDRNLKQRRKDFDYYVNLLNEYRKNGIAE